MHRELALARQFAPPITAIANITCGYESPSASTSVTPTTTVSELRSSSTIAGRQARRNPLAHSDSGTVAGHMQLFEAPIIDLGPRAAQDPKADESADAATEKRQGQHSDDLSRTVDDDDVETDAYCSSNAVRI